MRNGRTMRTVWNVLEGRQGFCRTIRTPISVWAIRVVVGSVQNISAVCDDLAGNEVVRFLAKVSGPREVLGPIGAPNSGDDASLRGGPRPRAAGPIKVGAVPPPLPLSPHPRLSARPASCCMDSTHSPLKPLLHAHDLHTRC